MVPQLVNFPDSQFHKNTNYIGDDGLIHNCYVGIQTKATLIKAKEELQKITGKLRKEGKPVHVLTNIVRLGKLNVEARMFAVEFIKEVDFDKVAIFGNHMIAEPLVNMIIIASGRGYKMKYFISEEDARSWLSY